MTENCWDFTKGGVWSSGEFLEERRGRLESFCGYFWGLVVLRLGSGRFGGSCVRRADRWVSFALKAGFTMAYYITYLSCGEKLG